jgi:hypothetical protein
VSLATRVAVLAGLAVGYLLLMVAALVPAPPGFAACFVAVIAFELVLSRRYPYALPLVLTRNLGLRFRVLFASVLVAVLAARVAPAGLPLALVLAAVLGLQLGTDATSTIARRVAWLRDGAGISWRNLDVPGLPAPTGEGALVRLPWVLTGTSLVLPVGVAVAWAARSAVPMAVAALLALLVVVAVLASAVLVWRRTAAVVGSPERVRTAVRDALAALEPEVLLHYSGRRRTIEQVEQWLPTLRRLRQRAYVIEREPYHLAALEGCGLPVVFAPRDFDVETFSVESVDLAFYVTSTANINNHQLRVPGIYDVFLGTGDSDEPGNASAIARMFDEIWVAGELGRERYRNPLLGVPASRLREVGALPLAARADRLPEPAAHARASRTVLVAPAWEGVNDGANLSSLAQTPRLLTALLSLPDVRVLYAPPAPAGARLPEYGDFDARARAVIEGAGGEHAVLDRATVAATLPDVSLVVTDIGPTLADAVAADRPYAVVRRAGWTEQAMRAAYPTLAGGAVVTPEARDLQAVLDDAAGPDGRAAARGELARRMLGPDGDFQRRFQDLVDAGIEQQRRRRSHARPSFAARA